MKFYFNGQEVQLPLEGLQGPQGPEGPQGAPFSITKVYASIEEMQAGWATDNVSVGQFVVIATEDVNDPDNAKLYVKGDTQYDFVVDLSGPQGPPGGMGSQGLIYVEEETEIGSYKGAPLYRSGYSLLTPLKNDANLLTVNNDTSLIQYFGRYLDATNKIIPFPNSAIFISQDSYGNIRFNCTNTDMASNALGRPIEIFLEYTKDGFGLGDIPIAYPSGVPDNKEIYSDFSLYESQISMYGSANVLTAYFPGPWYYNNNNNKIYVASSYNPTPKVVSHVADYTNSTCNVKIRFDGSNITSKVDVIYVKFYFSFYTSPYTLSEDGYILFYIGGNLQTEDGKQGPYVNSDYIAVYLLKDTMNRSALKYLRADAYKTYLRCKELEGRQ